MSNEFSLKLMIFTKWQIKYRQKLYFAVILVLERQRFCFCHECSVQLRILVIIDAEMYLMSSVLWLVCVLSLISGITSLTWDVKFNHVCGVAGSSVDIPCSFTHHGYLRVTKFYWGYQGNNHFEDISKLPNHRGRVQYFWNNWNKNCTLKLNDLMMSDNGHYRARIETSHHTQNWASSTVTVTVKGIVNSIKYIFLIINSAN